MEIRIIIEITAAVVSVIGGAGTVIGLLINRRKVIADAKKTENEAEKIRGEYYATFVQPLKNQIEDLKKEMKLIKRENNAEIYTLKLRVTELEKDLCASQKEVLRLKGILVEHNIPDDI